MPRPIAEDEAFSSRQLKRMLEAPFRHPLAVLVPLVVCLTTAVAWSFMLVPRYKSSTLILVAPDKLPSAIVTQVTTESVERRLQTLRQEVQSRTRLEVVARELDPYGTLGREPLIGTIERMRAAVTVSVKGRDAFGIEFEHRDPKMAMIVADRLTTLFMEEVVGSRERQVSDAYQFLESQLQDARQELEKKEKALRDYKQQHMGALPEQVAANLATLQRLQLEQQSLSENLRKAADTMMLLEGTPTLVPVAGGAAVPADPLAALRADLAQLRTRYTDEHPDVRALQARIASLEGTVVAPAEPREGAPPAPAVTSLAAQRLREARLDVEVLRRRLADVEQRIVTFQARVEAAPRMEQEITGLTRDYQKLSDNYTALLSKKMEAEMAAKLEQRWKGQQFRVLDPAYLPERPSFPQRGRIALGGALGGLLLGIGLAVTLEVLDPSLKDAEDVSRLLPYPVLAAIPYVGPRDVRRLLATPPPEPEDGDEEGPPSSSDRPLPFTRAASGGGSREAS